MSISKFELSESVIYIILNNNNNINIYMKKILFFVLLIYFVMNYLQKKDYFSIKLYEDKYM